MSMKIRHVALLFALAAFAPLAVHAQSFDCRSARHADEYAICENEELAALDVRMSNLYFAILNRLGGLARAQLHAEQVEWLGERRECGSNVRCLRTKYVQLHRAARKILIISAAHAVLA
jgi:uncharacterized protein